jgi:hypothetical protein
MNTFNIDIGRAVTYAFEDQKWSTKVGILALLGLVPGLNTIMWGGYALTIARRIMRGEQPPLPDWADWSDIAVRGLLSIVATAIYFLPVILLSCCFTVINFLSGQNSGVLTAIQCCFSLVGLIYGLAATLLLNVGHVRYIKTDQFSDYLDLGGRIGDLRANTNFYVMLFIYQVILGVVTAIICAILAITCIGAVIVATVAFLANGYVLGSAAASATDSGAARAAS